MSVLDEPIPYQLTDEAQAATTAMLTTEEAAALTGLRRDGISFLASKDVVAGVKVGRTWLVDRESLLEYTRACSRRRGRPRAPRLPAAPLLRQVTLRGGPAACGVRWRSPDETALLRAREEGCLTVHMADHLAVRLLGLHPLLVWGDAWLTV